MAGVKLASSGPLSTFLPHVYLIVWEFEILAGAEAEFERVYGPGGSWARLFGQADGFLGTELLKDAEKRGRYVTVDRWQTAEDYLRFVSRFSSAYQELDRRCAALTSRESLLGRFNVAGAGLPPA